MFAISQVVSIDDPSGGDRIKARVLPKDKGKSIDKIPYCFPFMPKIWHLKPKVDESVIVIYNEDNPNLRFYIGPLISQMQFSEKDDYFAGGTTALPGALKKMDTSLDKQPLAKGSLGNNDDVIIYGRKNTDIILSDNDVRIRCGARITNKYALNKVLFNKKSPAFIKLKYYPDSGESITTIVGNEINLISNSGDPQIKTNDINESISDAEMTKILTECHNLPYGDLLVEFLSRFYNLFKTHFHEYDKEPPSEQDDELKKFNNEYNDGNIETLKNKLLSKHIRIN